MLLSVAKIEKIMVVSCLTNKHGTAIMIIVNERGNKNEWRIIKGIVK